MKYLLDSNIVSEPSKPVPNEKVLEKLSANRKDCVISTVSFFEMLHGVLILPEGRRKQRLLTYLNEAVEPFYKFLSYDLNASKVQAEITAKLEAIGRPTPYADTQIASIAIANELILVTRNVKDFASIKDNFNLQIENWFED